MSSIRCSDAQLMRIARSPLKWTGCATACRDGASATNGGSGHFIPCGRSGAKTVNDLGSRIILETKNMKELLANVPKAGGKVADPSGHPVKFGKDPKDFIVPEFIAWGDPAAAHSL